MHPSARTSTTQREVAPRHGAGPQARVTVGRCRPGESRARACSTATTAPMFGPQEIQSHERETAAGGWSTYGRCDLPVALQWRMRQGRSTDSLPYPWRALGIIHGQPAWPSRHPEMRAARTVEQRPAIASRDVLSTTDRVHRSCWSGAGRASCSTVRVSPGPPAALGSELRCRQAAHAPTVRAWDQQREGREAGPVPRWRW